MRGDKHFMKITDQVSYKLTVLKRYWKAEKIKVTRNEIIEELLDQELRRIDLLRKERIEGKGVEKNDNKEE